MTAEAPQVNVETDRLIRRKEFPIFTGAVVFKRDMFLNIPVFADITPRDLRQSQIDKRVLQENSKQKNYNYKVGDRVYCLVEG